MQSKSRSFSIAVAILSLAGTVQADPQCQVFEDYEMICIAGDREHVLQRGLVSDNNIITKVTLRNCLLVDMDTDAFANDYFLKYIDLSENRISSLKPGVFEGNTQVTHLNLSYNLLTALPPEPFIQKPNLEQLDLKGNMINTLHMDVFVPLKKLVYLDLSRNEFLGKDLDAFIFSKNRKLKFLDLSRNDMTNTSENLLNALTELDILNLDRCSLKEIPPFMTKPNLSTMTQLVLSTNQITSIDYGRVFMTLENIQILYLAGNLIENIAANAFISLKKLKVVILKHNRLKFLPDGLFRYLAKLETVDLSHNVLEDINLNAFRGTALQTLDISHNRFSYLDSYFCSSLRNFGVRIHKLYLDNNPWQCACLNEILIEMKTFGIEYDRARYNGIHGVCVTTKMFTCKRQSTDHKLFVTMYDNAIFGRTVN